MLRSLGNLQGSTLHATDGEIGSVQRAFFDDEAWGVRYLVVKAGGWLLGREVLISPLSIERIDDADNSIVVRLTQQQVKKSPEVDTHKPVSRQHEIDHFGYYGYAPYWGGPYMGATSEHPVLTPIPPAPEDRALADREQEVLPEDVHLRSTDEVRGYGIHATDGDIGHVDDFLFDDENWTIRYLTVDTRNWWPGGKTALIATPWITDIDWIGSTVRVDLSRDKIRNSPEYDQANALSRDYETRLHEFYGKEGYWR